MTGRERLIQTKRETTHIRGSGEETRGKKQRERMKGRETGSNCMQQGKKTSLLKTASTVSQSFFLFFFLSFFSFCLLLIKACCQEKSKLIYLRGREREIFNRCSSGCDSSGRLTVGRRVSVFLILLLSLVPVQVMVIVHVLIILIMHRHQQGVFTNTPGWLLQHQTMTLPILHKFTLLGKTSPAEYLGHSLFTHTKIIETAADFCCPVTILLFCFQSF